MGTVDDPAVAEVDDLPKPKRPLSAAHHAEWLVHAFHRAQTDGLFGERRHAAFLDLMVDTLPSDPATMTMDGWTRLGAHQGAIDAWSAPTPAALMMLTMRRDPRSPNRDYIPRVAPPDCPTIAHGELWLCLYGLSLTIITRLRYGH